MKILVIRGQNLASLAGDFVLDLVSGPLASAGLFAITGSVGAGKSTVLDAMCLALFDRTPRLSARGGALVGRAEDDEKARVGANDVRGLLRRGTGSGFAEVEFTGVDGRTYRSRWSVRRARNKAGGAFQKQEMELWDLATDKSIGGKKTETLDLIEAKLGLSFEQFRRSALLAQGEFSSFLKAEAKDRAQLLERMTGTEIYGLLSIKAHQRGSEEQKKTDEFDRDLVRVSLLSPEEREVLIAERAELNKTASGWKLRDETWRKDNDWFNQHCALTGDLAVSAQGLEKKVAAAEALGPRKLHLSEVQKAQVLRPELQETRRADAAKIEADSQLQSSTQLRDDSQKLLRSGRDKVKSAKTSADEAADARTAVEPELNRARGIDQRVAHLEQQSVVSHKEHDRARSDLETARVRAQSIDSELATFARDLESNRAWLQDHSSAGRVAPRWSSWREQLESLAKVHHEGRTAEGEHEKSERALAAARDVLATSTQSCQSAQESFDTAQTEFERVDGEGVEVDRPGLVLQREAATKRRQRCADLATTAASRDQRLTQLTQSRQSKEHDEVRVSADTKREGELKNLLAAATAALDEALRTHQKALLTANFEEHRKALVDHEACPLCGALEHPLAEKGLVGSILEDLHTRVGELQTSKADHEREAATTRESLAVHKDRLRELDGVIAAGETLVAGLDLEIKSVQQDLEGTPEASEKLASWLGAEIHRLDASLSDLGAREKALDAHQKRLADSRSARDHHHSSWQKIKEAQRLAELLEVEKKGEHDRVAQKRADLQRREAEGFEAFEEVLSDQDGWRAAFLADKDSFVLGWSNQVEEWQKRTAAVDSSVVRKQQLEMDQAATTSSLALLTETQAKAAKIVAGVDSDLQSGREERGLCLDGQPVDAIVGDLDLKLRSSREQFETVRKEIESAERSLAELTATCEVQQTTLSKSSREQEHAETKLSAGLERLGFAVDRIVDLLGHEDSWIGSEQKVIADVERAAQDARVRHKERESQFAKHELNRPEDFDAQTPAAQTPDVLPPEERLRSQRTVLDTEKVEMDEKGDALRLRIDKDDAARLEQKDRLAARELHKSGARVWFDLQKLIGSADGKKFRTFAQSLTFENLLGYANRYLGDLAPRYRLMRVPEQDLELQAIDLDMGEEVRSIHSLSGGESFLVSLALALGLASMSARRTKVETLFIDEGFGTLDPQSLDIALSALDALQAQGHQVGIISHVSGLAERIGVQVRVEKRSGGRSELVVEGLVSP